MFKKDSKLRKGFTYLTIASTIIALIAFLDTSEAKADVITKTIQSTAIILMNIIDLKASEQFLLIIHQGYY